MKQLLATLGWLHRSEPEIVRRTPPENFVPTTEMLTLPSGMRRSITHYEFVDLWHPDEPSGKFTHRTADLSIMFKVVKGFHWSPTYGQEPELSDLPPHVTQESQSQTRE
jgi:hypothetical protein